MRRVVLLALLALALPTAALANSIDYAGFATATPATLTGSVSSGAVDLTFHQLSINGGASIVNVSPFGWFGSSNTVVVATPEPGTLGLLGTGLIGLAGIVRRKMRS